MRKYKPTQGGIVGKTLDVMRYVPMTNSTEDIAATHKAQDFQFGCWMQHLLGGSTLLIVCFSSYTRHFSAISEDIVIISRLWSFLSMCTHGILQHGMSTIQFICWSFSWCTSC
ncbi:beta-glucosidase 7-like [Carex rostrata]